MYYKKIKGNNEFGKITENLDRTSAEMSVFDHSFLGGIIEEFKPKKIIEIGVFSGRTTVDMLDFCYNIGLKDTEIYSVDIATENRCGPVGYLIEKARPILKNYNKSHLYTGIVTPQIIEEISQDGKFDLAVIDTTHYLPGEVLEFLALLPFMNMGGGAVFHDVVLNQRDKHEAQATKVAMDVIVGNKIWNWEDCEHPNIGAVQITEDTYKYIYDLISSLTLSWYYTPGWDILSKYQAIIEKYYDDEAVKLFKKAVTMNAKWIRHTQEVVEEQLSTIIKCRKGRVFIYGAGNNAKKYLRFLEKRRMGKYITGLIVSDNQKAKDELMGKKIIHLSEAGLKDEDLIINSVSDKEVEEYLRSKGISFFPKAGVVKERILFTI